MIPLRYNWRSLMVRKRTTLATVVGIGLVVFVLASSLMLAAGVQDTLGRGGRDDVGFVVRKGSDSELASIVATDKVPLVLAAPGVRRGPTGPIGGGEVVSIIMVEKLGADGGESNVQLRGLALDAIEARGATIVEGRAPAPGTEEVAVGRAIAGRFRGLAVGGSVSARKGRPWPIVGVFEANGSGYESEVWVDLAVARQMLGRDTTCSSIRAQLDSAAAFPEFEKAVEEDPRIGLDAMTEREYWVKSSQQLAVFVGVVGGVITFFFSLGAMIGAMITMYAAVANRSREVGVLRAMGFSRASVLVSFLLESATIALLGGALGSAAAMGMRAVRFSVLNFATFSEIVFRFTPTPGIVVGSLIAAVAMGLLGGFFPAWRAARLPLVDAIRGE